MGELTKGQHLIAFLIVLPGLPLSAPIYLVGMAAYWLHRGCERLYDVAGAPFLSVHRAWIARCERVNASRLRDRGTE